MKIAIFLFFSITFLLFNLVECSTPISNCSTFQSYSPQSYHLVNDIDCINQTITLSIPKLLANTILDGRGFTIRNMKIVSTASAFGLFLVAETNSTIMNITFEDVSLSLPNSGAKKIAFLIGSTTGKMTIKDVVFRTNNTFSNNISTEGKSVGGKKNFFFSKEILYYFFQK